MTIAAAFGFAGDFLSFLGGMVLATEAMLEERKRKQRSEEEEDWKSTITDPVLASITLTREGIKLKNEKDIAASIDISMSRRSKRLAIVGAALLALGFACLFCSRFLDLHEHAASQATCPRLSSVNPIF